MTKYHILLCIWCLKNNTLRHGRGRTLHGQLENENHWSRTTPAVPTKTKKNAKSIAKSTIQSEQFW